MITIRIKRMWYTDESITSMLSVRSDKTAKGFNGYALENSHAGAHGRKQPTPSGSYSAKPRHDGKLGWRIELFGVAGHSHIEIHAGNYPWNSHGCFLAGTSRAKDRVWHSREAMREIKAVVDADGSGDIKVVVIGRPVEHEAPVRFFPGVCWPGIGLRPFGGQTARIDRFFRNSHDL